VYTGAEQLKRIHNSTGKVYFRTPDKWEVVTQHTVGQREQKEQEVKWRKEASKKRKQFTRCKDHGIFSINNELKTTEKNVCKVGE
jgi:hypothetical protein